jgi:hypothetical protein
VYRLGGVGEEAGPVLRQTITGAASGWTPSLERCLKPGGQYGWAVRLADGEDGSAWSEPRMFAVMARPSASEVRRALATLNAYLATGAAGDHPASTVSPEKGLREVEQPAPGQESPDGIPSLATLAGAAAIRADQGDATGDTIGVAGISHSPDGVGVAAANQAGGADLLLDGTADAATDTLMSQAGIDRSSAGLETFDIGNSGGGTMALTIDGVTAVTTATDQDALAALSCGQGEVAKWDGSVWKCAVDEDSTYGAGNQLDLAGTTFNVVEGPGSGLDADTLDGSEAGSFAADVHDHFGEEWIGTSETYGLRVSVQGLETGTNAAGVLGQDTSTASISQSSGVRGESTSSRGVYGIGPLGVMGVSHSFDGTGVRGDANHSTGTNVGVRGGSSSTSGIGVFGIASAATGSTIGVKGQTSSVGSSAVWGEATATTGFTRGVYGQSAASNGVGVQGLATAATGETWGLQGENFSPSGGGVLGRAYSGTGETWGLYGENSSTSGGGVFGEATSTAGGNFGVWGQSQSVSGVGVLGWVRATTGTNYGVRGATDSSAGFDVYAAGAGTDYGPFTGGHEVKLATELPPELEPGMVMAVTGEVQVRVLPDETVDLSSTMPTVTLARRPRDPAVFGVLVAETTLGQDHWYEGQTGERFGTVNALGEGRVWATDANGPIVAGDYLTSSGIPGYAERQGDDLLHAYTLGKAIETVDWESVTETVEHQGTLYRVYLVAVVYTSG